MSSLLFIFLLCIYALFVLSTYGNPSDGEYHFVDPNHTDDVYNKNVGSECDDIANLFRRRGYFTEGLGKEYCRAKCVFNKDIRCETILNSRSQVYSTVVGDLFKLVEDHRKDGLKFDQPVDVGMPTDYNLLLEILKSFAPLVIVILAALSNMLWGKNFHHFIMVVSVVLIAMMFATQSYHVSLPFMIAIIGAVGSNEKNEGPLVMFFTGMLLLTSSVISMFVDKFIYQIILLIIAFAVAFMVGRKFIYLGRPIDSVIGISVVCLIIMSAPMILELIQFRGTNNLFLQAIMFLAKIMTPFGTTTYFVTNSFNASMDVNLFLQRYIIVAPELFYSIWFSSFFIVLIPRFFLCLAVVSRKNVKVKHLNQMFGLGIYLYAIDIVYAPFMLLSRTPDFLFGDAKIKEIRYYLFVSFFTLMEILYAQEIIVFRLLICLYDYCYVDKDFRYTQRFLGSDVHLDCYSFPKKGAMPWFSVPALKEIIKATYVTYAHGKRGVSFVRTSDRGQSELLTVRHVICGSKKIIVNDQEIDGPFKEHP